MTGTDRFESHPRSTGSLPDGDWSWVDDAADRFERADAGDLLAWAIGTFHPRLAISAGGGVDGMVIVDMAWRIDPSIRVFTLDTGRLHPETYTLFERVRDRYGIDVEFEVPDGPSVAAYETRHGPNAMYEGLELRTRCCTIRKVEPLRRKLATLDAWVAGLRREQWVSRRNIAKVEFDREHDGIVKLNPLADWSLHRVWEYVRANDVPHHELFDLGYTSIGCAPCTRAVSPGEPERAGRWWWELDTDKECGIHCSVHLLGSRSDSERAAERART